MPSLLSGNHSRTTFDAPFFNVAFAAYQQAHLTLA